MKHTSRPPLRYDLMFILLIGAMVGLGGRLAYMIHTTNPETIARADRQQQMVVRSPGRTGNIYARSRHGYVLLAGSRQVPSCFVDPSLLGGGEMADVCISLGDALGMDALEVQAKLFKRRGSSFVWIKRGISDAQTAAVRSLGLRSAVMTHEWRREYPVGESASPVVGFRRTDGAAGGGLELSLQRHLTATDGRKVLLRDVRRRPIRSVVKPSRPATDGSSVVLCMDAAIQDYLYAAISEAVEEFDARWGAGVVIDPYTGDVLAMCSVPSYDPQLFSAASAENRTNRAISLPFEPGSVCKPIFAAAAVNEGLMIFDTEIFCENGAYRPPRGGRITDHGKSYQNLTLTDVVVYSSNIGMAKVGGVMGNKRLWAAAKRFGFGNTTGVNLPGESPGILRPLEKWNTYSTPRVPFGQEISTTTLQVAMAFGALVNGGVLMKPRLVERVMAPDGQVVLETSPEVVRRVISPAVSAQMRQVLGQVVQRGTGKQCQMDLWSSLGKTGTAQIAGVGGYTDGAFTASFIGGAPASRPRVLCLISVYWPDKSKGHYGSVVAAPFVRDVLRRTLSYLNVPPDKPACVASASR